MKRKKIDWAAHVESFEGSGQRATSFCENLGLNVGTFRSHLYKYRARSEPSVGFQEILVNTELSLSIDEAGQITISGIEPDFLPAIVRAWSDVISQ